MSVLVAACLFGRYCGIVLIGAGIGLLWCLAPITPMYHQHACILSDVYMQAQSLEPMLHCRLRSNWCWPGTTIVCWDCLAVITGMHQRFTLVACGF